MTSATDDRETPGVSVILPTHDNATTIEAQLAALADQRFVGSWELIVVDNLSNDDTRMLSARWTSRIPRLRIVDAFDRRGVGYARNVGAEAAAGPVLAFCDADDVVDVSWLSELVVAAKSADVVTGRLTFGELNEPVHAEWRGLDALDLTPGRPIDCLWGGNFLIRRVAFEAVGGFDESFRTGGEDIDLDIRLKKDGWTISSNERAVVSYRLRSSIPAIARQSVRYGKALVLVWKKHRAVSGMKRPFPLVLKTWAWLVINSWWLLTRRRRGRWIWIGGRCLGRLAGSIRYRVVCL